MPISKMIEVSRDPRFGATKVFLLFETPQDLLKCIEGGVDIKKANIGSMAHSVGKVVVTDAIAMGDDDVKTIEAIKVLNPNATGANGTALTDMTLDELKTLLATLQQERATLEAAATTLSPSSAASALISLMREARRAT